MGIQLSLWYYLDNFGSSLLVHAPLDGIAHSSCDFASVTVLSSLHTVVLVMILSGASNLASTFLHSSTSKCTDGMHASTSAAISDTVL